MIAKLACKLTDFELEFSIIAEMVTLERIQKIDESMKPGNTRLKTWKNDELMENDFRWRSFTRGAL